MEEIRFHLRSGRKHQLQELKLASLHTANFPETRGLNSEKLDICKEEQASCEWTEYDDLPSSENLSAFPADMEMDALNKTIEQS